MYVGVLNFWWRPSWPIRMHLTCFLCLCCKLYPLLAQEIMNNAAAACTFVWSLKSLQHNYFYPSGWLENLYTRLCRSFLDQTRFVCFKFVIHTCIVKQYIQSQSVSPSEILETYTLKKVFRALHRLKRLEQVFCTVARGLCAT